MKAAEFFNSIFEMLGYQASDEKVAPLVAAMAAMDLPDEIKDKFHSTFMTEDVAKTKLRPTHRAEAYSQIEQDFQRALEAIGVSKEEYSEFVKGQDKLAEKLNTSVTRLKEKLASAQKGGNEALVNELKGQIESLNQRIESEKAAAIQPFQERLSALQTRLAQEWENGTFAKLPVSGIPDIAKVPAIKAALSSELDSLGGDYFYDVDEGKVKLHKKGDKTVPLYLDNKEADWNSILSSTITKHFTLAKPESGGTGSGGQAAHTQVQLQRAEGVEGKLQGMASSVYDSLLGQFAKT